MEHYKPKTHAGAGGNLRRGRGAVMCNMVISVAGYAAHRQHTSVN